MYLKMYVNKATKRFEGFELRGADREGPSRGAASSTYVHVYVHVYVQNSLYKPSPGTSPSIHNTNALMDRKTSRFPPSTTLVLSSMQEL